MWSVPRLHGPCPCDRNAVNLKLLVSPTPLPSGGAGASSTIALRDSRIDVRRPFRRSHRHPRRPKTVEATLAYAFFFLRLVFFAVFFAAVFVFVLRFFAMLPS